MYARSDMLTDRDDGGLHRRARPVTLAAHVLRAMDAAVLVRLGLISPHPASTAPPRIVDPQAFWHESGVLSPPPVEVAREAVRRVGGGRAARRTLRTADLTGVSHGPGGHEGSRRLVARAYVREDAGAEAPLVLLLHGYAAPNPRYEERHARQLLARGLHAARLDLPFHLHRRLPGRGPGDGFFSTDLEHTRAVVRQSVEDAAAVVAWARREVTPHVAVLGFSLGGLVAALLGALVPLDGVVSVTPPADLAETLVDRAPMRVRRRAGLVGGSGGPWGPGLAEARAAVSAALAPVTPALLVPVTDPSRVTLVAAENDLIVGSRAVLDLATAWGTDLWVYRQGHVTVMWARGLRRRVHDRLVGGGGLWTGRLDPVAP